MKINIITGAFIPLPPAGCGAVERVWHGLAPYFAAQGHEVTFYACTHSAQAVDETVDGVRFARRCQFKQTSSRAVNILLKDSIYALNMLRILEPADIFICNDFCTGLLYPYLGRQRGGKLILNIARIPKRFMRGRYRKAACLAAVSEAVREAISEIDIRLLDKTRVVPNAVYTDVFQPPEAPRNASGPQTLLYTGRIHPEKGLHLLTEAFARIHEDFPQLRLKIVGPWRHEHGGGGTEYLTALRGSVSNLPVEFGEPVNDVKELAALLQSANYYCYPSLAERGETFGVAALEASASGIPPVVSNLKCFREFVKDGANGFVFDHRTGDPSGSLAETLRRMLTDTEQMEKMRMRAVNTADQFSYDKVSAKYLKIFEEVLKSDQ